MFIRILSVWVILFVAEAAIDKDLVTDLPGLTFTPKFKHYSGYLKATGGRQLHYWFVHFTASVLVIKRVIYDELYSKYINGTPCRWSFSIKLPGLMYGNVLFPFC